MYYVAWVLAMDEAQDHKTTVAEEKLQQLIDLREVDLQNPIAGQLSAGVRRTVLQPPMAIYDQRTFQALSLFASDSSWRTEAMERFLLLAAAAVAFAQQPNAPDANYYSLGREAQVGQRFATQLQANVTASPEPRLDQIGNRLAAHSPQFRYRFFVFDGGQPSQDTAPAAAFPADWRRLQLDEAIAVAGGMIFVPRPLLSRDDAQLAAILAHAMGHIALRHPTMGMTRGELAQVEVQVASRAMPDEAPQRVQAIALDRFAFDRACETAADGYAVKLLHDAGLDPAFAGPVPGTLPPPANGALLRLSGARATRRGGCRSDRRPSPDAIEFLCHFGKWWRPKATSSQSYLARHR